MKTCIWRWENVETILLLSLEFIVTKTFINKWIHFKIMYFYRVFIWIYPQGGRWRVDCERTTDQLFKFNLTFCVVCIFIVCRLTSGGFTIDFSTPTLRIHLNEPPIVFTYLVILQWCFYCLYTEKKKSPIPAQRSELNAYVVFQRYQKSVQSKIFLSILLKYFIAMNYLIKFWKT
jgi:hypothetical protein